jgi:hypothetical protein
MRKANTSQQKIYPWSIQLWSMGILGGARDSLKQYKVMPPQNNWSFMLLSSSRSLNIFSPRWIYTSAYTYLCILSYVTPKYMESFGHPIETIDQNIWYACFNRLTKTFSFSIVCEDFCRATKTCTLIIDVEVSISRLKSIPKYLVYMVSQSTKILTPTTWCTFLHP